MLNLQGRSEWQWPEAARGKGKYQWALSPAGRARGAYLGTAARLRRALDKLKQGKELVVSTIGGDSRRAAVGSLLCTSPGDISRMCARLPAGSITAGQGAVDAPNWPQWVANWLQDEFGGKATVANGAVGGTLSSYMSVW